MNYYNVGDTFTRRSVFTMAGGKTNLLYVIDSIEVNPNYFLDTGGDMYRIKFKVYEYANGINFDIGVAIHEVRSLYYCQTDYLIKGNLSFKNKKLKKLAFV